MGCDIHSHIEVRNSGGKWVYGEISEAIVNQFKNSWGNHTYFPFATRSYSVFGFLADVRNYSKCPYIDSYRGLPDDSEYLNEAVENTSIYSSRFVSRKDDLEDDGNYHSFNYLYLWELLNCDYDAEFVNMRGSSPETMTVREHLGSEFFAQLEAMRTFGNPEDVRLVMYFDS